MGLLFVPFSRMRYFLNFYATGNIWFSVTATSEFKALAREIFPYLATLPELCWFAEIHAIGFKWLYKYFLLYWRTPPNWSFMFLRKYLKTWTLLTQNMERFRDSNLFKISLFLSQCLDFSMLRITIAIATWKTEISMTFSSLLWVRRTWLSVTLNCCPGICKEDAYRDDIVT